MNAANQLAATHSTLSQHALDRLESVPIFASVDVAVLQCLQGATEVHVAKDTILLHEGELQREFWILLDGSINIRESPNASEQLTYHVLEPGSAFGETSLVAGLPSPTELIAATDCNLLAMSETQFWNLLNTCPEVRKAILGNLAKRLTKIQKVSFQQEKMASLGTMAAGLMHELNNPGSAARRASAQLRENLLRMHRLTARFSKSEHMTQQQKQCLFDLQELALSSRPRPTLSSLEQADAEQELLEWMEAANIEDAWKLAPTLVSVNFHAADLECAHASFTDESYFSDAINWLEALVSSMQLVETIEESVGRVTDLVHAVKSYAYEGRGKQTIDINSSIHATVVILGHKLREKQIVLEKDLALDLPQLESSCHGLNQVWTNLLDNAIDAVPQGGTIRLRTWPEDIPASGSPARRQICFLVGDNGPGIPLDCQAKVFDPFFTTKPVGIGTGLGLGIVYRIVEQYGGTIHFSSAPGNTEFVVRLPQRLP